MNYWFVVHDLPAYEQHSDMIGSRIKKTGERKPKFSQFAEIKKGDKIIYYATKENIVIGAFKIASDIEYLSDDPEWKEIMVYKIKPLEMPKEGYYLDFKQLLKKDDFQLSIFPDKNKWYMYLQGKTCRPLTKEDFDSIKSYFSDERYLKDKTEIMVRPTKWHKRLKGKIKKLEKKEDFSHDDLLESLITIGEVFGFETSRKPSVNELRPSTRPFRAKGKTLDLAWRIHGLTWVPFEIQIGGSVPDLIYRFQRVHQWSLKMVVVADTKFHEEIREVIEDSPFYGKIVLLTPEQVVEATNDIVALQKLRENIFS